MKKRSRLLIILALALVLPVAMMMMAMSGVVRNASAPRPEGPCDIYAAAGTPCMAAHSSTRALYASYNGPLYQVMRQSDGKTLDIGLVQPGEGDPGGYADAAAQDAFCANTLCLITIIYDQSENGNHMFQAPPGTFKGPEKGGFNTLPIADMAPITLMGHKAYGVYIIPGMGLRNNNAKGLAINDEPEGIYMVFDGKHFDSGCCFNYGNTSTNSRAVGRGTMNTVYFGTSTAWGSGDGPGPWIMSDMEAGLFSGYNVKQNIENPTIDKWRFVTGVVNGGGGNQWDIRGGNAQENGLKTFYSGIRPSSRENSYYYPMHRKGAIQLGNGGDNGNGSSGTFYEGVMTKGYPSDAALNAVQANIVSARYDVQRLGMTRVTSFTPESAQDVTATFTNTTGMAVTGVKLSISVPKGWKATVKNSKGNFKVFNEPIAPDSSVNATFTVISPAKINTGFLNGKSEWKDQKSGLLLSETISQRVRNVSPVKINEVRLDAGATPSNQFIELYNADSKETDISNWSLISTQSEWAPVKLVTIPAGTKIPANGFYLLGLSGSGIIAPAVSGDKIINVRSISGFEAGQQIDIDGEKRTIATVGSAASPLTTIFVPVSTGPWLTIPAGSTNIPVTNGNGFEVGQKIGIDLGGNYEVATVTAVGKASTQTSLTVPAKAGDTVIKVAANNNMTVGDELTIGTGSGMEIAQVKRIISVVSAPIRGGVEAPVAADASNGNVELATPLRFDHILDVDVAGRGTGISFSPATRFEHKSGEGVQALGSGITLDSGLGKNHVTGAAVINPNASSVGYQGSVKPNQWFGLPMSSVAGSIALMDASGVVVIDAMVYGTLQSNSSANGTVASPELATLEGVQSQGGCIVVVQGQASGYRQQAQNVATPSRSYGRYPDGNDTDSNCTDFLIQSSSSLSASSASGATNIKVASVADLTVGQKITIDMGANIETATITMVGTTGATTLATATTPGAFIIPVTNVAGFATGQSISIDNGSNSETAIIAAITPAPRGGPGGNPGGIRATIKIVTPLSKPHDAGAQFSGSGITLASPLTKAHNSGAQIASFLPTPGAPNQYLKKP
jgi:sRNA-binding protein